MSLLEQAKRATARALPAAALPRLGTWTYGALLLAIVACLWFPATALPLGGPNVVISAALVLFAGLYAAASAAAGRGWVLSQPIFWLLGAVAAMLVCATVVTIATDTFSVPLVGQIAMGGSVLAATWVAVDSQHRARVVATVVVGATALSVLFGLAVIYIGDPLWRVWVVFANPEPRFANDVLLGRIAGISPRVVNLAFQLVVAAPLAVGLLLFNPLREAGKRRAYDLGYYALALILCVGIYFNTSRSAALAGGLGVSLVLGSAVFAPRPERGAVLRRTVLVALALFVGFSAVVYTHQAFAPEIMRPAEQEVPPECETSLGAVASEFKVDGAWDERCNSLVIGDRRARLYTFSVDSPRLVAIELSADVSPYLYLFRGTGGDRELGNQNNENHEGGVGENARLVDGLMLQGDYTVEATTKFPDELGRFTLTFTTQCGEDALGTIEEQTEGESRTSAWSAGCPRYERDPTRPARYFTFTLAEPLPISVYVQAEGLWPTMRLFSLAGDQEWPPVRAQRETTGDRSKVLRAGFDLPAGRYRLEVAPELANVVGNFGILVRVPEAYGQVTNDGDGEETSEQALAPGTAEDAPGTAEDAPGTAEDAPGTAEDAPGTAEDAPGTAEDAPGTAEDAPGTAEDAPGTATSNKDMSLFDAAPRPELPLFKPERLEGAPTTDRKRLVSLDSQAFDRVELVITALRYAREFPFGTGGKYEPRARHVDYDWGTRKVQAALAFSPHNQFLLCLVQYGVIGLALLLLFYGGAAGALVAHWRRRWRGRRCADLFLLIAVAGAVAGYVGNSFFHDHGPFTKDWFHCFLVGLLLAVGLRIRDDAHPDPK